jgi:hypothetical protein
MVSQLLYDLPANETYRIIFMERDMDETLLSQEKMLQRLGRQIAAREDMKRNYAIHLERLFEWLPRQRHFKVLRICYNNLVAHPREHAERVSEFLRGMANVEGMVKTVDPSLYRNRNSGHESVAATPA